jgi:hypothetical protein
VGIGLVMQVLILCVQNDAEPQDIGVATSTATFFRSIGGSVGVAVFGAIFASRLADQLAKLPPAVTTRLGGTGVHLDPAAARRLPPAVHHQFLEAFAHALHGVFLWGVGFAVVASALSWLLREVPLRTSTRPDAELAGGAAVAGGTGTEALAEPPPAAVR